MTLIFISVFIIFEIIMIISSKLRYDPEGTFYGVISLLIAIVLFIIVAYGYGTGYMRSIVSFKRW